MIHLMKKVLFVATVDQHIIHFHLPYIKWFKERGYEVHVASRGNSDIADIDVKFDVNFQRKPLSLKNLDAYKTLKRLVREYDYELVHCHTPVAGALTRLAFMNKRKLTTKVIYTAHGFHFYKGAPIQNWIIFYPIERFLSKYTDTIITINREDYENASRFRTCDCVKVNGVGINISDIILDKKHREKKRQELGLSSSEFVIMSVGELNKNKNHEMALKAIAAIENSDIKYLVCGEGHLHDYLEEVASELGIAEKSTIPWI